MEGARRPATLIERATPTWGRVYFALQALAGAAWWIGVFTIPAVRTATLGTLDAPVIAALDIPLFVLGSALVGFGIRAAVWVTVPWTILVAAGMALYATLTGTAGWGALLMIAAAIGSVGAGVLVLVGRVPSEWLLVGPFRFRPAGPSRTRSLLSRTGAQILVFSGLFLVLLPAIILFLELRWGLHVSVPIGVRIAGGGLLIAAFALSMWSAASMSVQGEGTPLPSAMPRRLVIAGPYRYVRNPMAVGGIAQGIAVGMIAGSWLVVLYALGGSLLWNTLVRPLEEADLEERFGSEFRAYRDRVSCWLPRRPQSSHRNAGTGIG
ncbi:protein-S-isoprenylcysteine O-methyltransferase Ste14 [Microbacterium resistens]|uniref:Protein-S-isoprenylcysteine O-methyltransferase Ste14 n=1 Tax=Microbacterium resistens TaxID=156977 RepID=A0ABU1S908_9MICO|nr:isoprenylcysteine carboxylmethyltransferase family protein [Microbacterium resistens]MDR6866110.1 protein-S-isoprenylcysteine O-methyltransferase Ste14 [Microbacterium resistens]